MPIYRLYICLSGIAPPIWRTVEIASNATLARLHRVLQAAMGWQDYHLHEFEIGGQRYGEPDSDYDLPGEVVRENTAKLAKILPGKGASLLYTYDFGDNWQHTVTVMDVLPPELNTEYPRVVDGARSCPPEDCGGIYGYFDLLKILSKPRHKEYRRMREWAGKDFDPEKFSLETANRRLRSRTVRTQEGSV